MNIIKLDGRYSGCHHWKYLVEFNDTTKMFAVRNWCWEVWGASCEREYWFKDPNANQHWSWSSSDQFRRIYLRTDTDLSIYMLKFHHVL